MKLPPKLEKLTDFAGMLVALVVDLALNITCFLLLAPDMWTAIAFACIGVMLVLFVFKSWSKGQKFAWVIFVAVVFFFDYSFALEATRMQTVTIQNQDSTESAYEEDFELKRLVAKQKETSAALVDLQSQYREAMRRETLEELDSQISKKEEEATYYERAYQARMQAINEKLLESSKHVKMTSEGIFNAIPRAYAAKRYTELVIYGFIFFGLQLIVVTSIEPLNKKKKKKKSLRDILEMWVKTKKPAPVTPRKSSSAPIPKAINTVASSISAEPLISSTESPAEEPLKAVAKPVVARTKVPLRDSNQPLWQKVLTPIRDNELKAPDAIAYETGASVDSVSSFLSAVASIKGPAGSPLVYNKADRWYLAYTKELVIATVSNHSRITNSLQKGA